mmetsp:Transcript_24229/g.49030  ORF Transcript_24229/g.49030 Transcript_24229/m.49030 type:complete len:302 (-) Transcript_24229:2404-3309(-)
MHVHLAVLLEMLAHLPASPARLHTPQAPAHRGVRVPGVVARRHGLLLAHETVVQQHPPHRAATALRGLASPEHDDTLPQPQIARVDVVFRRREPPVDVRVHHLLLRVHGHRHHLPGAGPEHRRRRSGRVGGGSGGLGSDAARLAHELTRRRRLRRLGDTVRCADSAGLSHVHVGPVQPARAAPTPCHVLGREADERGLLPPHGQRIHFELQRHREGALARLLLAGAASVLESRRGHEEGELAARVADEGRVLASGVGALGDDIVVVGLCAARAHVLAALVVAPAPHLAVLVVLADGTVLVA